MKNALKNILTAALLTVLITAPMTISLAAMSDVQTNLNAILTNK